jgi:hypothetical protein
MQLKVPRLDRAGEHFRVTEVSKSLVEDRLELVFPGLRQFASGSALGVDVVIGHAKSIGAQVTASEIDVNASAAELAIVVLRDLPSLHEDVFVVSDQERCFRVPAERLVDFVSREPELTGEVSFDGDELFVCTRSKRVVVLHHEGWVFDVVSTRVSELLAVCNACLHLRSDVSAEWIRSASEGKARTTYYCDDDFAFVALKPAAFPTPCPSCKNTSIVVPVDEETAEGIARFTQGRL